MDNAIVLEELPGREERRYAAVISDGGAVGLVAAGQREHYLSNKSERPQHRGAHILNQHVLALRTSQGFCLTLLGSKAVFDSIWLVA